MIVVWWNGHGQDDISSDGDGSIGVDEVDIVALEQGWILLRYRCWRECQQRQMTIGVGVNVIGAR